MKFVLATLCLNEMEWLPLLYKQHQRWPDLFKWVFVEAADRVYAETNPTLVNSQGLSVDGTSEYLQYLASKDSRVQYIPYGFSSHPDPALGKVPARQAYLDAIADDLPEFVLVLDADEFYCEADQPLINETFSTASPVIQHFCFQFTHIWHPASLADTPLFSQQVTGGFWAMRHTKGIRWRPSLRYQDNHQLPSGSAGAGLMVMYDKPACIHMAFASESKLRTAKHEYYRRRGEDDHHSRRRWYVRSRRLFETYSPGRTRLPRGARVVPYTGPIPEVFQCQSSFAV